VITDIDFDRLRAVAQSPRYLATHASAVAQLRQELDRGEVVPALKVPGQTVTMRSRVRVRDIKRRETATYTLVYPDEADMDEGKVSVLAPLGIALLGARAGATVSVHAPAGVRRLKIERIFYQPESAGDLHL
jgi:regulator of nucleoside diphosphate kinase